MTSEEIIRKLSEQFGEKIVETEPDAYEPAVIVSPGAIADVCSFLKSDPELDFKSLMCLSAIDLDEENLRVDYHLYSITRDHKFKLKVIVPKNDPKVPTISSVWKTADWHEREAYDLIGVVFENHPDFRRILLPDDWEGHPLRKDYVVPDTYREMPVPYPGTERNQKDNRD